jgi:hypothetical protein
LANRQDELLDQILALVLSQELPAAAQLPAESDLRQQIDNCIDNFLQCHSKAQIREVIELERLTNIRLAMSLSIMSAITTEIYT